MKNIKEINLRKPDKKDKKLDKKIIGFMKKELNQKSATIIHF